MSELPTCPSFPRRREPSHHSLSTGFPPARERLIGGFPPARERLIGGFSPERERLIGVADVAIGVAHGAGARPWVGVYHLFFGLIFRINSGLHEI
jgi:hypothetical protein